MFYAFGEFELDPRSYELRRHGKAVELQPKVVELLGYLVDHRERVIGKQELLSVLWPEVHVTEASLVWCVSQARKALGQERGARGPIETVHRRGYRFGGEVRTIDPSSVVAPSRRASGSPFVGRQHAMSVLGSALERVRVERRGAGCLLLGEAGIGKTRCAEELAGEACAAGVSAWIGRCLEEDETPPFWPWIQILRACLREQPAGALKQLAEELSNALTPTDSGALDPEFMNGRSDGFWVVDRMVRFLARSAEGAPRLVVVDDLQWADIQSLRVLERLAPDLEQHGVLILATLRDTDEPTAPSAKPSLERLRRHFASVPLSGLVPGEVEKYLAAATGRMPSVELVTQVHGKTGGNPLFVQEMAQRLIERAPPDGDAEPGDLAPLARARSFMLARLARRDPKILEVLEAASVLGETFDLAVLAATLGAATDALVGPLEAAVDARLIERRPGATAYAFVHALVRDAVLSGVSAASRCSLHRRAGEALESRAHGGERLAQLAFHFHHALPSGTHVKAAHYAAAAAQEAARVFAHEAARTYWTHALEALDFHPLPDPEMRCRVLVGWAATEKQLGLRSDSRERLKQAIVLAKQRGSATQLVAAARVLRHSLVSHQNIDPLARDALETALPLLTEGRERATALSLLGAVHVGAPSSARSREAGEQAMAIARTIGGQTLLEALWSRAFALSGPDDVRELLDVSAEMLRLDASLGRSWWSGEAYYAEFCAHAYRGDMPARDRAFDELGKVAKYCRLPEAIWNHDRVRAQVLLQTGAVDESERAWRELSERAGLANLGYVKVLYAMHRAAIDVERTGMPDARRELWRLLSSWSPGPRTDLVLVDSLVIAGRLDEARTHYEEISKRGLASLPRDRLLLASLATLGVAAIALDDRAGAVEIAGALRPYATFNATDVLLTTLGSVAHYLGLLSEYLGDKEQARADFDLARARNREMGLRPCLARTERALEELLSSSSGGAGARRRRSPAHPRKNPRI